MEVLGNAADGELPALLEPLVVAYGDWVSRQRARLEQGADGLAVHREAGAELLDRAEEARKRVAEGIELLRSDKLARDAFRFANRAMALQRAHSLWSEHRRRGGSKPLEDFAVPDERRWYPFQLAFVLLNLPSLTDPKHQDRAHPTEAIADLLWYPTGGGKTEAYLGLSAYVMALRRLQGPLGGRRADAGVAVLMRYTLRVLTLQQFQRASALVCACEVLRREDEERWGDGEVPDRPLGGAEDDAEPGRHRRGCAEEPARGHVAADGQRPARPAGELPVVRHGDRPRGAHEGGDLRAGPGARADLLRRQPRQLSVFAAQRAGRGDSGADGGRGDLPPASRAGHRDGRQVRPAALERRNADAVRQVDGRCERHGFRSPTLEDKDSHPAKGSLPAAKTVDRDLLLRPPDLVIQDELHLISGPLGTMVGLYETAVDRLASWELDGVTVRPKVIASTATVRKAADQVHQLFLRQVRVFPPPGLDVEDNFFAREQRRRRGVPGPPLLRGLRTRETVEGGADPCLRRLSWPRRRSCTTNTDVTPTRG